MTTDHSPSLDEIREVAEAALDPSDASTVDLIVPSVLATHIAMMDPQTTLGLVTRLERAENLIMSTHAGFNSARQGTDADVLAESLIFQRRARALLVPETSGSHRAFTEANPTPGAEA